MDSHYLGWFEYTFGLCFQLLYSMLLEILNQVRQLAILQVLSFRYCVPAESSLYAYMEENMKIERCIKESFTVIGKEGSTLDGEGFIQELWADANSHFEEVQNLAKGDKHGNIAGIWGAISDFSHSFNPWEEFSKGLYLAGVECGDDAEPPNGWTKRTIPIGICREYIG